MVTLKKQYISVLIAIAVVALSPIVVFAHNGQDDGATEASPSSSPAAGDGMTRDQLEAMAKAARQKAEQARKEAEAARKKAEELARLARTDASKSGEAKAALAAAEDASHRSESERRFEANSELRKAEVAQNSSDARKHVENELARMKESIKTKLDDKRKQICVAREAKINTIIQSASARGQAAVDRITAVELNVEKFVTDKGLVVANYDALVAAAKTKQVAAAAAVSAADASAFKCDDQDASTVGSFVKGNVSTQRTAIKAYRDSVKALVAAVKQASEAAQATASPTPSTSPTATN